MVSIAMNNKMRIRYYLSLITLPLFFIIHGLNENTGLIKTGIAFSLLSYYIALTMLVGFVSARFFKDIKKSYLFSFFVLSIFFFFGVFKDFAKKFEWLNIITRYVFLFPGLIVLIVIAGFYLKRATWTASKVVQFISVFLIINLCVETVLLVNHSLRGNKLQQGLGDEDHALIRDIRLPDSSRRPIIFWIVFDEYTSSDNLKRNWNFNNPIDSILRKKGFFVADSATSNYNYTLHSLSSTLDMQYLKNLGNHSIIGTKDFLYKWQAIGNNNVVKLLNEKEYLIENFSIYDVEGSPSHVKPEYDLLIKLLIDNQTLSGRVGMDIGQNLPTLLATNKGMVDSINKINRYAALAASNTSLLNSCLAVAKAKRNSVDPCFFMFHFMYTHMPLIYNSDGSLDLISSSKSFAEKDKYVPSVQYANLIIDKLTDSIKSLYAGKDFVILLQGDHGFKFGEQDPSFDRDSPKILYAVYCSDNDYSMWKRSISSVNSFRILFNKYFHTGFPLLPDHAYMLYTR